MILKIRFLHVELTRKKRSLSLRIELRFPD